MLWAFAFRNISRIFARCRPASPDVESSRDSTSAICSPSICNRSSYGRGCSNGRHHRTNIIYFEDVSSRVPTRHGEFLFDIESWSLRCCSSAAMVASSKRAPLSCNAGVSSHPAPPVPLRGRCRDLQGRNLRPVYSHHKSYRRSRFREGQESETVFRHSIVPSSFSN